MRNPAASSRRRIRHHRDGRTLKQICQPLLRNVSTKVDARVAGVLLLHRFDIAVCLRMIPPSDDELHVGELFCNQVEGLHHQFEFFVGSPFSKSKNAVSRISSAREVGEFGPARQDAVRAQMNIVPPVLVVQNFAIAGHENGNRIRKQEHACGDRACKAIQLFIANADVFQFHSVHQVMQGHMRIASAEAS